MKRTGFKRPEYAKGPRLAPNRKPWPTRTPAEIEAACGLPDDSTTAEHRPAPAVRRGTYAHADMGIPISLPKPEAHRNPHLLAMARGKPCLFRLPGICNFDPATTVACHSNLGAHGKGGARKADDEYSAWGCFSCHCWLDQGNARGAEKELAFMAAHLAQVCEWRAIAGNAAADPKDIAAARWALARLNATPIGQLEMP